MRNEVYLEYLAVVQDLDTTSFTFDHLDFK